jgi:Domain of unknown function (DUF4129)
MTRRDLGLFGVGGAAVLASAWAASLAPLAYGPDTTHASGSQAPADYIPYDYSVRTKPLLGTSGTPHSTTSTAILWILAVAVALLVGVVLVLLVRAAWRRLQDRPPATPPPPPLTDVLPGAVAADAQAQLDVLAEGLPSDAIVACWVRLERSISQAGVPLPVARTSTEVTVDLLRRYSVDVDALNRLAALYREARFSRHQLSEAQRTEAAQALERVHQGLRDHLASESVVAAPGRR